MAQRFTAWLGKPWGLGQAIFYGTLAVELVVFAAGPR